MDVHVSVLLNEILAYLDPKPGEQFIDATLNGGGHTFAIAERVVPGGTVLGIEWDIQLAEQIKEKVEQSNYKETIVVVNDTYTNMEAIAKEHDIHPKGIIFDLGLSSWHYEGSKRGFSFKRDEPLDMRFNEKTELTAAGIINTYSEKDLVRILKDYGEEQFAESIAESIVATRGKHPIITTTELVAVIESTVPGWYKHRKIHCATKTFQALRVEVNQELQNVEKGVEAAINVLETGGILAVISFQGLEDKIVRELFKKKTKEGIIEWVVKGTIRPKWEEQKTNPRSRSAKLKIIRKL